MSPRPRGSGFIGPKYQSVFSCHLCMSIVLIIHCFTGFVYLRTLLNDCTSTLKSSAVVHEISNFLEGFEMLSSGLKFLIDHTRVINSGVNMMFLVLVWEEDSSEP